jgi:hypothetical protein
MGRILNSGIPVIGFSTKPIERVDLPILHSSYIVFLGDVVPEPGGGSAAYAADDQAHVLRIISQDDIWFTEL